MTNNMYKAPTTENTTQETLYIGVKPERVNQSYQDANGQQKQKQQNWHKKQKKQKNRPNRQVEKTAPAWWLEPLALGAKIVGGIPLAVFVVYLVIEVAKAAIAAVCAAVEFEYLGQLVLGSFILAVVVAAIKAVKLYGDRRVEKALK